MITSDGRQYYLEKGSALVIDVSGIFGEFSPLIMEEKNRNSKDNHLL